jgi:hypothetical protein
VRVEVVISLIVVILSCLVLSNHILFVCSFIHCCLLLLLLLYSHTTYTLFPTRASLSLCRFVLVVVNIAPSRDFESIVGFCFSLSLVLVDI